LGQFDSVLIVIISNVGPSTRATSCKRVKWSFSKTATKSKKREFIHSVRHPRLFNPRPCTFGQCWYNWPIPRRVWSLMWLHCHLMWLHWSTTTSATSHLGGTTFTAGFWVPHRFIDRQNETRGLGGCGESVDLDNGRLPDAREVVVHNSLVVDVYAEPLTTWTNNTQWTLYIIKTLAGPEYTYENI